MKKKCKKCGAIIISSSEATDYCSKCEMNEYFIKEMYLSAMGQITIKEIQIKSESVINKYIFKKNIFNKIRNYFKDRKIKSLEKRGKKYHKI